MKQAGCCGQPRLIFLVLVLVAASLLFADAGVACAEVKAAQPQPVTKDAQKIIAVLVEFPDVRHTVGRSVVQNRLSELDVFYREVSYGLAWIKANVTDRWYEVPTALSKWDIQKWAFNNDHMREFRRSAIAAADRDINYRDYDYVVIVAAGKVWPNAASSQYVSTNDGVNRLHIIVLNEQSEMGAYAHELGHLTPSKLRSRGGVGLPDLYSYEAAEKGESSSVFVGSWCIMSVSRPPRHFCAWGKMMFGWITPEVAMLSATQVLFYTVHPIVKDSGLRALVVPLKYETHYVIEVRVRTGFDGDLPSEGVLLYHVDESKKSGHGVVKVVDRNPLTKTLDDAAFQVGDKFEDDENSVYMVVAFAEGAAYAVAISGSKILSLKDTDEDGLMDYIEERLGTDPKNPDTDGDGLQDGEEVNKYGTDARKPDTDGDGLTDGDEMKKHKTDPLKVDTDADGLTDGEEVLRHRTDPLNVDTDGDELTDGDEINKYRTDPLKSDTDGDELTDSEELFRRGTSPLKADTDGDLWNDRIDIAPTNPFIPNIFLVVIVVGISTAAVVAMRRRKVSVREPPVTSQRFKYCINCGTRLHVDSVHCTECGARQ